MLAAVQAAETKQHLLPPRVELESDVGLLIVSKEDHGEDSAQWPLSVLFQSEVV